MRFQAFLNRSWPGVLRAKGFFWLATRPHYVGEISQAGPLVRTGQDCFVVRAEGTDESAQGFAQSHDPLHDHHHGERNEDEDDGKGGDGGIRRVFHVPQHLHGEGWQA